LQQLFLHFVVATQLQVYPMQSSNWHTTRHFRMLLTAFFHSRIGKHMAATSNYQWLSFAVGGILPMDLFSWV